jgi:predicted PurR-regulated permease PerM
MSLKDCPVCIDNWVIIKQMKKGLLNVPFLFSVVKGEAMKLTKRYVWLFLTIIILIISLFIITTQWDKLASLFKMLVVSIVIAYVLTPLCDILEKKLPRIWAIAVIILTMAALLALIIMFFIPALVNEVMVLIDRFPIMMKSIRNIFSNIQTQMNTMGIPANIQESIVAYVDYFQEQVTAFVMHFLERSVSGITVLPTLFIEIVLGFYFLKDREYFAKVLTNIIPLRSRRSVLQVASEINHILHSFIRGEVFIASVVGTLATAGYLIIGLPYALILGFLAAVLEFIPYFGPWLGAFPAIIIASLAGTGKLLWTLVVIILIQQLENIFIAPKILSQVVDLHPVYIILSLWTGGMFFGVIGMFLAVPSVLILRIIIKHIYLKIVAIR